MVIKRKPQPFNPTRSEKGIISFPRFFIKAITGGYSIYHRLTHAYLESASTEEELVEMISSWESKTEEELWRTLLFTRGLSISTLTGVIRDKHFEQDEEWYYGAWGVYTTKFYEDNPSLYHEVTKIPTDIINMVRQEIASHKTREHEKHMVEIEEKEREYRVAPPTPKPPKPKEEPPVVKKRVIFKKLKKPVNPFD